MYFMDDLLLGIATLNTQIARVRELHNPIEVGVDYGDNYGDLGCPSCNKLYPCPTIQALDGETNDTN